MNKILTNKKIAMIIAFRDFRDVEYFTPRDILLDVGCEVSTISTKKGTAIGADGGKVEVDDSIDKLKVENFDGIIFIGGPGMVKQIDNKNFHLIAKSATSLNKVLGAICIAPVILSKAGVLKDKKATVWSSNLDKSAIGILKENGAKYQDKAVVIDGNIITASGPQAAEEFGNALVNVLVNHNNK